MSQKPVICGLPGSEPARGRYSLVTERIAASGDEKVTNA